MNDTQAWTRGTRWNVKYTGVTSPHMRLHRWRKKDNRSSEEAQRSHLSKVRLAPEPSHQTQHSHTFTSNSTQKFKTKLRWILFITDEWWIRSSLRPLQIHQIHHSSLMGVMNQNSSWRTAELNLLWSQFTTRSSPSDRRLHNDALNTSAPDSQRMLVPSNQSRRIVIALENVEILRQEKQSCARRGSWSSLPRPPWRTSHTALFPLFSSNAVLGSLLLQVYKWKNIYTIETMSDNKETQRRPSFLKVQTNTLTR